MYLYLVRHGDAFPGSPDHDRALSEKGKEETKKIAKFLKTAGVEIPVLYHSGLKRAEETADIIAKILNIKNVTKAQGLAPDDAVLPFCQKILKSEEDLMVVGHMPYLSNLASKLFVDREEADFIEFKKSAVLVLTRKFDSPWRIAWLVTPKLLP